MEQTVTGLRQRVRELEGVVRQLRGSRSLFEEFFDSSPAGYLVHDQASNIAACNRVALELLGLRSHRQPGALFLQFVCKQDIPSWWAHLNRCISTRARALTELNLRGREDRVFPAEVLTLPGAAIRSGRPPQFYTVFFDISQRRAAEAALAATREDYRRLIDAIEGIVWEADARSLDVTFVSRFAERILGYPLSEWQRPEFWINHIYVEDRERVVNQLAQAVARREDLRVDYRVLTAARQLLWLHDSITVVERDGKLKVMGVAIDVTDRRKAEKELRSVQTSLEDRIAERTATLSETVRELEAFSYSLSHDLRSPLRSMLGFAELALQAGGPEASQQLQNYLQRILAGGHRADRLIRDILTYCPSSRADLPLGRVDTEKLVRELIEQYPEFQAPRAEVEVRGPLLPMLGHEASLAQCVTNLLGNAVKFVPPGTRPHVNVWTEMRPGSQSRTLRSVGDDLTPQRIPTQPAHCVRLYVQDNGIGIAQADLERIFNIFERVNPSAQYEGTGIGLAIVRKGAERMGGSAGVESEPGKGSKFWIELNGVNGSQEAHTSD